jgi:RNA polymerase sigma factor (sigma-70 family)
VTTNSTPAPRRGDEAELYRRHRRDLLRAVARVVNAPDELIEDACQNAWAILLRNQPDRVTIFARLRVVAIHEAYRLSRTERRDAHLDELDLVAGGQDAIADPSSIEDALEARWALRLLAELPDRQREDLSLLVAGFSYSEIADMTGGRTYTNVNRHLTKARARIRLAKLRDTGAISRRRSSFMSEMPTVAAQPELARGDPR